MLTSFRYEYNGRALKVHYDKFSQLGQLPLAPNSSLNSPLLTNQLHPTQSHLSSRSGGYTYDVFGQNSDSSSLFEELVAQQGQLQSHPFASPRSRIHPPQLLPLQQASRSQSSSSTSSSSQSRSFDRETAATSITSLSSTAKSEVAGASSPHTLPSQASNLQHGSRMRSRPPSPPRTHLHPHHPGPISLPPLAPLLHYHHPPGSFTPGHSPLYHPYYHPHLTPHGLPPITPTMPPFTFIPQPSPGAQLYTFHHPHGYLHSSVHQNVPQSGLSILTEDDHSSSNTGQEKRRNNGQTTANTTAPRPPFAGSLHSVPPTHSPGLPGYRYHPLPTPPTHPRTHPAAQLFSPLSPGALWGGGASNPFINPAVGQPVRMGYTGTPGDVFMGNNMSGFAHVTPGGDGIDRSDNSQQGYFDFGYFPPVTTSEMKDVSDEIMKPKSEEGDSESPAEDTTLTNDPVVASKASAPQIAPSRTYSESTSAMTRAELTLRKGNSDPVHTLQSIQQKMDAPEPST